VFSAQDATKQTGENVRNFHRPTTATIPVFAAVLVLIVATQGAFARSNTGVRPISSGKTTVSGVKTGATKGVGADGGAAPGGSGGGSAPPKTIRPHRPDWPASK
jgi:hypothetical protein